MKLWRLGLFSGMISLLALPGAKADLLEYRFTDTLGEEKVLQAGSEYANPVSDLTFALSGGLDRKVRMLIRDDGGAIVSSASGSLLGANDRIQVNGNEFYGERLQLPVPADGSYEFVAQILSSDGAVISEQVDPVRIHTAPPVSGGFDIVQANSTEAPGFPHRLIGGVYFNYLQINGITSDIPLAFAKLTVKDLEGGNSTHTASTSIFGGSAEWKPEALFSNGAESTFELVARLRDKAGNETEVSETFYYDKAGETRGIIEAFAIYDPDNAPDTPLLNNSKFEGFIPYVPGMTISQNPIRLIARLSRNNYKDHTPFGLGYLSSCRNDCLAKTPFYTDDKYVYLETYKPYEFTRTGSNRSRLKSYDQVFNSGVSFFDVNVAKGTAVSPKIKNLRIGFKGNDQLYPSLWIGLDKKDWLVNRAVVTVEPRPYRQRITVDNNRTKGLDSSVIIEPNETTVTVDLPEYSPYETRQANFKSYRTMFKALAYSHELPTQLRSENVEGIIDTNFTNPEVNDVKILKQDKEVHVEVHEDDSDFIQGTVHRVKWFVDPGKSQLELRSSNGDYVQVPFSRELKYTHWKRRFIYDLSAVPDGVYTRVRATAIDAQNNKTVKEVAETVIIDNTAPAVHFNLDDDGAVVSLDDIFISVSDNSDSDPQIASVELTGGPANDQINLPVREVAGGQYQLEYPILFPSSDAGTGYEVVVTVKDEHGNLGEGRLRFEYKPPKITLEGGLDSRFFIPAVAQEVIHKDGSRLIETAALKLADGSLVTGTYDVLATLRADAPVAYMVNGKRIEPGQTLAIMSEHDFAGTNGKLSIGAYPAEAGIEGASHLLIMTTAPNSPILSAELRTWLGRASLNADSWTVKQVLDPVAIQASPAPGTPCRLTTAMTVAAQSDPIDDPICEFVWTQIPDESARTLKEGGEFQMMQVEGVAFTLGEQQVAYEMAIYGGDGTRIIVGTGEQMLSVVSASGSVSFAPSDNLTQVHRGVEAIAVQMKQVEGTSCTLTLDAEQAKQQDRCLFEWTQIPTGLQQNFYSQPYLTGKLPQQDVYSLQWRVSKFAPSGKRVTLAEQSYEIEAINPPAPKIAMAKQGDMGGVFFASLEGGTTTDIVIEAPASTLLTTITRDDVSVLSERYTLLNPSSNRVYQSLQTLPLTLWQEQEFTVVASYAELPEVTTSKTITAVGVPALGVLPVISVAQRGAVDTELLPVTVSILDTQQFDAGYDAATMGEWEARVVYDSGDGPLALSEYAPLSGGTLTTDIDISEVGTSSLRLFAQARLLSGYPGYERVERSVSPAFVAVLRGNAIDAEVASRAFSGPAPLNTYFKLNVGNYLDRRAVGKVVWQVSDDNAASWRDYEPEDERRKFQFHQSFEKGSYLVRARIANKNSGAISYTEQTRVTAYEKFEVALSGPSTVVVGSNGSVLADVTLKGEPVSPDAYVLEWSTDAGQSFIESSGASLVIEGSEEALKRIVARVRAVEAPEDDRYAYAQARHTIGVRGARDARAMLLGPNKLEVGKSYTFNARLLEPYHRMNVALTGEFVFPDGSKVPGTRASYTVREADLEDGRIDIGYTAWLAGFRETTSKSVVLRARVWAYEWPSFTFAVRSDTRQVPTIVKASARASGLSRELDNPVFEWTLPPQAKFVKKTLDTYRSFVIEEAGAYEIGVKITDARGNETVLSETLTLQPSPEFEVDLSYTPSNRYNRAPLNVFLRPQVSGGHPRDRVVSHEYLLNGKPLPSTGSYARADLGAGENEVELKIHTKMGVAASGSVVIEVVENQPPTCELTITEASSAWVAQAKCSDPDGRVVKHNWQLDGQPVTVSSTRLTVSKRNREALPQISVSAGDDAGAVSEPVFAQ